MISKIDWKILRYLLEIEFKEDYVRINLCLDIIVAVMTLSYICSDVVKQGFFFTYSMAKTCLLGLNYEYIYQEVSYLQLMLPLLIITGLCLLFTLINNFIKWYMRNKT